MKIDLYAALKTLNFTLQNGKSISNGIKLLEHNAENKKEKIVYQNIYNDLKEGSTLSKSMQKNKLGSIDIVSFIAIAEKNVNFKSSLSKVISYLEIKNSYARESNEKTNTPFIYLFIATIIVFIIKFIAIPYQLQEAQKYSKEILELINSHLQFAYIMSEILFILLTFVIIYFFTFMNAIFSHSRFMQNISKYISIMLPFTSEIVFKFEKFMLFSLMGEMLKSGISYKNALIAAYESISITKYKNAIQDTLKDIQLSGKFQFHPKLYDEVEKALLIGAGSSTQIGGIMSELSLRAKDEALILSSKFFRFITLLSILLMAFAVFIEFYTVVLTQLIIQKGLIDLAKGSNF